MRPNSTVSKLPAPSTSKLTQNSGIPRVNPRPIAKNRPAPNVNTSKIPSVASHSQLPKRTTGGVNLAAAAKAVASIAQATENQVQFHRDPTALKSILTGGFNPTEERPSEVTVPKKRLSIYANKRPPLAIAENALKRLYGVVAHGASQISYAEGTTSTAAKTPKRRLSIYQRQPTTLRQVNRTPTSASVSKYLERNSATKHTGGRRENRDGHESSDTDDYDATEALPTGMATFPNKRRFSIYARKPILATAENTQKRLAVVGAPNSSVKKTDGNDEIREGMETSVPDEPASAAMDPVVEVTAGDPIAKADTFPQSVISGDVKKVRRTTMELQEFYSHMSPGSLRKHKAVIESLLNDGSPKPIAAATNLLDTIEEAVERESILVSFVAKSGSSRKSKKSANGPVDRSLISWDTPRTDQPGTSKGSQRFSLLSPYRPAKMSVCAQPTGDLLDLDATKTGAECVEKQNGIGYWTRQRAAQIGKK